MEIRNVRHAVTLALTVAQGSTDEINLQVLSEYLEVNQVSVTFRDGDCSHEDGCDECVYSLQGPALMGMGNKSAREDKVLRVDTLGNRISAALAAGDYNRVKLL